MHAQKTSYESYKPVIIWVCVKIMTVRKIFQWWRHQDKKTCLKDSQPNHHSHWNQVCVLSLDIQTPPEESLGYVLGSKYIPQISGEEAFGCLGYDMYDQTKHSVAMSCVCSQPRWFLHVTAQTLPVSKHNETTHPSDDLELPNCHHLGLHHPRRRRIHLPESQQRPQTRLESAGHP